MTIGIGLLGSDPEPSGVIPNRIVLVADTMGSWGDEQSHPRLHKTFVMEKVGLCAVAANQIDKAASLLPMIQSHMERFCPNRSTFGEIKNTIQMACFLYKREQFISRIFPKYRLEPNIFSPDDNIPQSLDPKIQEEWEKFDIGCDLIIGAFDCRGQASLFHLMGDSAVVEEMLFPGYVAIGSGCNDAMFWLSYRKHTLSMSSKLAAFHGYEAKLMAESSAHVNEHIDLVIAQNGKYWSQSTHDKIKPPECPITLSELERMRIEFGPKDIATFTRSSVQKSEPEP